MDLYPLLFQPLLKEKVWGGRRLADWGRELPEGVRIGESWEIADLEATSASGAGGGAARSIIANGPLAGTTLGDLLARAHASVMGDGVRTRPFPLLIKYLDAMENLSVQVHPSQAWADAHPDAHLKTESWYVLDAQPGAKLYIGLREGVTREDLAARIQHGTVEGAMVAIDAVAGDVHHLPSGTCHALGAGVLVAEVQTASDTTFRVFDWGRTGRELHVEAALACIDFGDSGRGVRARGGDAPLTTLVETPDYTLRERRIGAGPQRIALDADRAHVWMVIAGHGLVDGGAGGQIALSPATTLLIPASLGTLDVEGDAGLTILETIVSPEAPDGVA